MTKRSVIAAIGAATFACVQAQMSGTVMSPAVLPIYTTVTILEDCTYEEPPVTITEDVTITSCPACSNQQATAMPTHTTVYAYTYVTFCPTGLAPATVTITEQCTGETPHWPMTTQSNYVPPGFTTTVSQCTTCGAAPITATLTVPCEKCMGGPAGPTPGAPGGVSPPGQNGGQNNNGQQGQSGQPGQAGGQNNNGQPGQQTGGQNSGQSGQTGQTGQTGGQNNGQPGQSGQTGQSGSPGTPNTPSGQNTNNNGGGSPHAPQISAASGAGSPSNPGAPSNPNISPPAPGSMYTASYPYPSGMNTTTTCAGDGPCRPIATGGGGNLNTPPNGGQGGGSGGNGGSGGPAGTPKPNAAPNAGVAGYVIMLLAAEIGLMVLLM